MCETMKIAQYYLIVWEWETEGGENYYAGI